MALGACQVLPRAEAGAIACINTNNSASCTTSLVTVRNFYDQYNANLNSMDAFQPSRLALVGMVGLILANVSMLYHHRRSRKTGASVVSQFLAEAPYTLTSAETALLTRARENAILPPHFLLVDPVTIEYKINNELFFHTEERSTLQARLQQGNYQGLTQNVNLMMLSEDELHIYNNRAYKHMLFACLNYLTQMQTPQLAAETARTPQKVIHEEYNYVVLKEIAITLLFIFSYLSLLIGTLIATPCLDLLHKLSIFRAAGMLDANVNIRELNLQGVRDILSSMQTNVSNSLSNNWRACADGLWQINQPCKNSARYDALFMIIFATLLFCIAYLTLGRLSIFDLYSNAGSAQAQAMNSSQLLERAQTLNEYYEHTRDVEANIALSEQLSDAIPDVRSAISDEPLTQPVTVQFHRRAKSYHSTYQASDWFRYVHHQAQNGAPIKDPRTNISLPEASRVAVFSNPFMAELLKAVDAKINSAQSGETANQQDLLRHRVLLCESARHCIPRPSVGYGV
jgi:hypothetical protein